ncbi:MAG: GtrA family protein [Alphaproteobacteria bacterium]|nr:GtrA family protein [Alphaproteobacteria bacterium]
MKVQGGSARQRGDGRQLASFVVTGAIAAAVNLVARWLLSLVLPYEVAIMVAFPIAMTTAFLLARRYVFAPGGGGWVAEYGRFILVNLMAFVIVLGVSVGFARLIFPFIGFVWHPEDIAHLIGVMSPLLLSYYAHKHYSFATREQQP